MHSHNKQCVQPIILCRFQELIDLFSGQEFRFRWPQFRQLHFAARVGVQAFSFFQGFR